MPFRLPHWNTKEMVVYLQNLLLWKTKSVDQQLNWRYLEMKWKNTSTLSTKKTSQIEVSLQVIFTSCLNYKRYFVSAKISIWFLWFMLNFHYLEILLIFCGFFLSHLLLFFISSPEFTQGELIVYYFVRWLSVLPQLLKQLLLRNKYFKFEETSQEWSLDGLLQKLKKNVIPFITPTRIKFLKKFLVRNY